MSMDSTYEELERPPIDVTFCFCQRLKPRGNTGVYRLRRFVYTRLFDVIVAVLIAISAAMSYLRFFLFLVRPRAFALLEAGLLTLAVLLMLGRILDLFYRRRREDRPMIEEEAGGGHDSGR